MFQILKHMFHCLEYIFHTLEYMFQTLKQNFYHREKTFIALSCNNLSTVFQKCINYALFHGPWNVQNGNIYLPCFHWFSSRETCESRQMDKYNTSSMNMSLILSLIVCHNDVFNPTNIEKRKKLPHSFCTFTPFH